jgi:hypothetical protein
MASLTGPVTCFVIGDDFCFMQMTNPSTSKPEFFVVWTFPNQFSSVDRIRLSMWVAMLRDAISNQIAVTVTHNDNSAAVIDLQFGG